MSRQELADAVSAWLFEHEGRTLAVDYGYIGKLERGEHRWPSPHYRNGIRGVLGAATDAELGFFIIQGHGNDANPEPDSPAVARDVSDVEPTVSEVEQTGRTLLRALLVERHWQVYRTFHGQFRRAAHALAAYEDDPTLTTLDVSPRQFQRWIDGARPRPDACRVLESMFGHPIARLIRPAASDAVVPVEAPGVAGAVPVAVNVSAGAGMAVTVVRHDGAPGWVAVSAGAVRVLIDVSGVDSGALSWPVVDAPVVDGGARVYSLAERRAR